MINMLILITLLCLNHLSLAEAKADGIDGCNGGTSPASNGKFYKPDGKQCHPSDEDAEKTKPRVTGG